MFEKCTTLSELNQERALLIKQGAKIVEVNSAYNAVRPTLMMQSKYYAKVPSFTCPDPKVVTYTAMPLLGESFDNNLLIIEAKGIRL